MLPVCLFHGDVGVGNAWQPVKHMSVANYYDLDEGNCVIWCTPEKVATIGEAVIVPPLGVESKPLDLVDYVEGVC